MSWVDGLRHRLSVWFRPTAFDREIAEEMTHHLDLDAAQQQGSTPASLEARRRFGNRTYYTEERRTMTGIHFLDGIMVDARHLLRSLRHSPGFALVAILTLAVGIGVT